jgi:hypothetical protein
MHLVNSASRSLPIVLAAALYTIYLLNLHSVMQRASTIRTTAAGSREQSSKMDTAVLLSTMLTAVLATNSVAQFDKVAGCRVLLAPVSQ